MVSLIERTQIAVNYVAKYYAHSVPGGVFCQDLYDNAHVFDVTTNDDSTRTVTFKVYTVERLKNNMAMVHGGASSTMIVLFSALSLASDDRYWKGETPTEEELKNFAHDIPSTRSVDNQILQAVPLKTDVYVKCHIISNTKSNAFITTVITNSKGKNLVVGVHDMIRNPSNGYEPHSLSAHFPLARL